MLRRVFDRVIKESSKLGLDTPVLDDSNDTHIDFINKIRNAYAVIVVSISEVSPNIVIEAIQCGTPFIITDDNGLMDKIKDFAITADPLDESDLFNKIIWMLDPVNRDYQAKKISSFSYTNDWTDIAGKILEINKK